MKLHLVEPVRALRPSGIHQHIVDVGLAGLVFGDVQRLGDVGGLLLGAAGGEFIAEGRVLSFQVFDLKVLFRGGSGSDSRLFVQQPGVELPLGIVWRIAIRHIVHEAVQVLKTQLRLILRDLLALMGRDIADLANEIHSAPGVVVHNIPELVRIHQADQLVVPGHFKGAVNGIHPFDGVFHRPAAVDHGG